MPDNAYDPSQSVMQQVPVYQSGNPFAPPADPNAIGGLGMSLGTGYSLMQNAANTSAALNARTSGGFLANGTGFWGPVLVGLGQTMQQGKDDVAQRAAYNSLVTKNNTETIANKKAAAELPYQQSLAQHQLDWLNNPQHYADYLKQVRQGLPQVPNLPYPGDASGAGGSGDATPKTPTVAPATYEGGGATVSRSALWPAITKAAAQAGVPAQLAVAYLQQESGGGTAAADNVGQIRPSTAANPGYGMSALSPEDMKDQQKNIAWSLQYMRKAGDAAGVTDWTDSQQWGKALRAYNGTGDSNYVSNVARYLPKGMKVYDPGLGQQVASSSGGAPTPQADGGATAPQAASGGGATGPQTASSGGATGSSTAASGGGPTVIKPASAGRKASSGLNPYQVASLGKDVPVPASAQTPATPPTQTAQSAAQTPATQTPATQTPASPQPPPAVQQAVQQGLTDIRSLQAQAQAHQQNAMRYMQAANQLIQYKDLTGPGGIKFPMAGDPDMYSRLAQQENQLAGENAAKAAEIQANLKADLMKEGWQLGPDGLPHVAPGGKADKDYQAQVEAAKTKAAAPYKVSDVRPGAEQRDALGNLLSITPVLKDFTTPSGVNYAAMVNPENGAFVIPPGADKLPQDADIPLGGRRTGISPEEQERQKKQGELTTDIVKDTRDKAMAAVEGNYLFDNLRNTSTSWQMGRFADFEADARGYVQAIASHLGIETPEMNQKLADYTAFEKNVGAVLRNAVRGVSSRAAVQEYSLIGDTLPKATNLHEALSQVADQFQALYDYQEAKWKFAQTYQGDPKNMEFEFVRQVSPATFLLHRMSMTPEGNNQLQAVMANLQQTPQGKIKAAHLLQQLKWGQDNNLFELAQ